MTLPVLSLNETGVLGLKTLPTGNTLTIHLSRLTQQVTGLHARIAISVDDTELARTVMNAERLEDRVKLANAAYKDLHGDIKKQYSPDFLKIDLAYVCANAWDCWLAASMPKQEAGQETIRLEWLLEPYVLKGGGTILFGAPGGGKSYLGMAMVVSVDNGESRLWETGYVPSLWVNLERSPDSVRWRLAHINKALGLAANRDLLILHARGKRFRDILDLVKATIKQHDIRFVGVDSLSRMGVGSLVKDEPINEAIDMLNGLGVTWLALGHTPTSGEEHVYGGNLWTAGADITAQLTSIRRPTITGLRLETFKSNDTPIGKPLVYALEFGPGLEGLTAIHSSSLKEFPELAMRKKSGLIDDLVTYLKDVTAATATKAAHDMKLHTRPRISEALSTRTDLFVRFGPKTGQGQAYALLAPPELL